MPEPSRTIREEDLDFTADASWSIFRHWDTEPVRLALRDQVPGSRGVDLLGVRDDAKSVYLIEVKDYRSSEDLGSTRQKLADAGRDLAEIVACKARDTVAGLIGAARHGRDDAWRITRAALAEKLWIVLWIEHAGLTARGSVRERRSNVEAVVLKRSIVRRCRWLDAQVEVCSRDGASLPGLTVTSIAGAARTPGRRSSSPPRQR